jgi:hypothetical protein
MKNSVIVLVCVLGLTASSAFAQSKAPLTGLWKCTLKVEGSPDQSGEMDLKQDGKDVKGTGSNSGGSAPMHGTFVDPDFKLIVDGDAPWNIDGKLTGGKMIGTFAIAAMQLKGAIECSQPGAAASAAPASASAALTGVWKCQSKMGDQPPSDFQLDLTLKGETVTGTGSSAAGTAPLTGTFKDGNFKAKIDAGDTVFELEGKLVDGKLSGTLNIPAMSIKATFEGKK